MIKSIFKLEIFGCPIETFVSYEKLKADFNEGKKLAFIMETPFRARVGCENFIKQFSTDEQKDIEITEFTFVNKISSGMLISVHNDKQLKGFDGTIIN